MIKVTDLRIDNWAIAPKIGLCQVNGIQLHSDGNTYIWVVAEGMEFQHSVNLKDLKGVELTDEILEKCGFTTGPYDLYIWRKEETFCIAFNDHNEAQIAINEKEFTVGRKIKLLHDLQNLYHAFTGEELSIVLPV